MSGNVDQLDLSASKASSMPAENMIFGLRPESDRMLFFDLIRFLSAIAIVIHHSNSFVYDDLDRVRLKEPSFGLALFVDLFFLLSGYVICSVYFNRISNLRLYRNFLQKRFARLLPLHIAITLVLWLIYTFASIFNVQINSEPDTSFVCLAKTLSLTHAIAPCDGPSPNAVSWSISAEVVMYCLFPAVAWLLRKRWIRFAMVFVGFGAVVLLANDTPRVWTETYAPLRALPTFAFGAGLFVCLRSQKWKGQTLRPWGVSLLSVLLILMSYMMITGRSARAVLLAMFAVGAVAAVVDLSGNPSKKLRAYAGLGRLTYSVYVIHPLFVLVFLNVLGDKKLHLRGQSMWILISFNVLMVIAASVIANRFFEEPLRRRFSPKPPGSTGTLSTPLNN